MEQGGFLVVIFVTSLIFIAALSVAMLEQRLEDQKHQLTQVSRELANQAVKDNLTKLPNRLYLAEYAHLLFSEHQNNSGQYCIFVY